MTDWNRPSAVDSLNLLPWNHLYTRTGMVVVN